jgi:hypothetical protein
MRAAAAAALLVALAAPAAPAVPAASEAPATETLSVARHGGAVAPSPAASPNASSTPVRAAAHTLARAAALPALPADEIARLARAEVVVLRRPSGTRLLDEVIGWGAIEQPPERVFRALVDHRHYHEWVPFVTRSAARPGPGGAVLHAQSLDLPRPLGDRSYEVLARSGVERSGAPPGEASVWRTSWDLVPGSGNLRLQRGSWTLVELAPGRTLALCRLVVHPGGMVPAFAINRTAARAMPWIFDGLRQHVNRWRYDPTNPTAKEIGEP